MWRVRDKACNLSWVWCHVQITPKCHCYYKRHSCQALTFSLADQTLNTLLAFGTSPPLSGRALAPPQKPRVADTPFPSIPCSKAQAEDVGSASHMPLLDFVQERRVTAGETCTSAAVEVATVVVFSFWKQQHPRFQCRHRSSASWGTRGRNWSDNFGALWGQGFWLWSLRGGRRRKSSRPGRKCGFVEGQHRE